MPLYQVDTRLASRFAAVAGENLMLEFDLETIVARVIEHVSTRSAVTLARIVMNRWTNQPIMRLRKLAVGQIKASHQHWLAMSPDERGLSIAIVALSGCPLIAAGIMGAAGPYWLQVWALSSGISVIAATAWIATRQGLVSLRPK